MHNHEQATRVFAPTFQDDLKSDATGADRSRPFLAAVVALVLCFNPALGLTQSPAAGGASFTIGATVLPRTGIVAQTMPATLEVRASDIERGFVEVPGTMRLTVINTSRDGFALDFWTSLQARRLLARIFVNDRLFSSSIVKPLIAIASAPVIAPQFIARRK